MSSWVTISDIGGGNPQRLPTNGTDRSWAVETPGTLSAEVLTRTLTDAGLDRPKGRWITVEGNDVGTWAGVVQETQARADGTSELTATDWRVLLQDTRLPKRARPRFAPPGTLALLAIAAAERNGPVWIRDRTADETGLPVQLRLDGQSLGEALASLQSASGESYRIDPDTMAFHWGPVGIDRSGSRQLVAPRHIVDWTLPDSIAPVINDLLAFPTNEGATLLRSFLVEDPASIAVVGRRQGQAALAQGTTAAALRPTAQALVTSLAALGVTLEMQLVNVDRCFGWFREGDSIAVLLPSINAQLTVRIMARSIREPDWVMDASAIVTDWRAV
jgi:hypothetical protein